jgi:2-amino-4-hydroxy-6-hydroxymethyldihydropteridine diphosphokinase
MSQETHKAILLIGSNINPQEHIKAMLRDLAKHIDIIKQSKIYQSHSVGSNGPDFLNLAIEVHTTYDFSKLKFELLRKIEEDLGRVRGEDKYMARTADIDIVLFDGDVIENNLWKQAFIAVPVAELFPDLKDPQSQLLLFETASVLKQSSWIIEYPAAF